jgi:fumarate reductase subunit C
MKRLFAILFTLALMVGTAYAHNGMEHVMGTVAGMTNNSITVTTKTGKAQTVMINADTKFTRMDAVIAIKDIKVGDKVVIHATEKDEKLTAATVRIGIERN